MSSSSPPPVSDDAYVVLGLSSDNSESLTSSAIRRAYLALALKWHPDKNAGSAMAAAVFARVFAAHETLQDASARAALDARRAAARLRALERGRRDARRQKTLDELEARERASAEAAPKDSDRERERRLAEEIERLRREVGATRNATRLGPRNKEDHMEDLGPWKRVPGFQRFFAATIPFEQFERDVLEQARRV